jgi:hypothetical protein
MKGAREKHVGPVMLWEMLSMLSVLYSVYCERVDIKPQKMDQITKR